MKNFVPFKKQLLLFLSIAMLSFGSNAQTYTTQCAGNWNSASTWVGGMTPGNTIAAGMTVNVKHSVTFNINNNLSISGALNVTGDTLWFQSTFNNREVKVLSGGTLKVTNGGFIQNTLTTASTLSVDKGRVVFENARVIISRDFEAVQGAVRTIKNSFVTIGGKYDLGGNLLFPSIDTIKFSNVETNTLQNGEFRVHANTTLRVANAYVKVNNSSDFRVDLLGKIQVLPDANSNIGFDYLKVTKDLRNDGTWNARIDASCVNGNTNGTLMGDIDFTRSSDCSTTPLIGPAPELVFKNPVLVSGTANHQGAIYRFPNVMTGVDAQIRLKKFSRNDIVMQDIDLANLGWDKAFQPQFGLSGNVAPNQNWYIDFELKFYVAGTNTIKVLPKVDMTALDVDGDGVSITEYASFQNPSNVMYSTLNNLTEQPSSLLGQLFTCPVDALSSLLINCLGCGGDGKTGFWNLVDCAACEATGILHTGCNHAFEGVNGNAIHGPVTNFTNIDTAATQVMAVYQFTDRSVINFRYGAKSGSGSSSAGIRLNSLWYRQFSLSPVINIVLPVKLASFTATLNKNNKAELKWTTASEINLSHFVVERSTDGTNYSDAGIVFAYGNTTDNKNYVFPDNLSGITAPVVYYRLRSVDVDGKSQYSETRMIRLGKQTDNMISILTFPNPVTNELRISIPDEWQNKKVTYEILNANGQSIQRTEVASSSQTESLNTSSLAKGFYVIRVICEGQAAQQKIIKQ